MVKAGLIGALAALVVVAITFLTGDAVSGPLMVTPPGSEVPEEVTLGAALFSTVVGGVFGIGIAALCSRFAGAPAKTFLGICVVSLVVYGVFPFLAGENIATGIWLNIMHVAAAIPIVGSLTRALDPVV